MSDFFEAYQLNLFATGLMLILLVSLHLKREIYRFTSRVLRAVTITIIAMLLIEILSWVFDGLSGDGHRFMNYSFNWLFFVLGPVAPGFMASYVDYVVHESQKQIKKRTYYMYPFFLNLILGLINLFTPIVFKINDANIYSREYLMPLGFIGTYILLFYCLYMVFREGKHLTSKVRYSIAFFLLMPITGAILQMLFLGLRLMWAMLSLGVIIAYIFTEMISSERDFLTGLYTRSVTTEYIARSIELNAPFSVILLDLDDYKSFNDKYGHREGDKILVHFGTIMEQVFPKGSIVSRFGGDEFVVVTPEHNAKRLLEYRDEMENIISTYEEYPLMREIKFSFGLKIRNIDSTETLDDLINLADKEMYNVKSEHKAALQRRATDK